VKLIRSFSTDRGVSSKRVVVYGPDSRYQLVKASSGDLIEKSAREQKGFYLIVLHGHFVGFSHPAGAKAPSGTVETQVWSATEGVTDTGIGDQTCVSTVPLGAFAPAGCEKPTKCPWRTIS